MIRLRTGSVLVRGDDGSKRLVDLCDLKDVLWDACQELGLDDPDLPADVIGVVATFVEQRSDLDVTKLDRLVVKILMDSGLHALAESFAAHRGSVPELMFDEVVDPDDDAIGEILRSEPFFLAKPIKKLTTMVLSQLEKLGFTTCGRNLIVELARNTWSSLNSSEDGSGQTYWLMSRAEIAALVDGPLLSLLTSDVIEVKSVSSLLPALHVSVSMMTLARKCGAGSMAELTFYPALHDLCNLLPELRAQLGPVIERRRIGMSVKDLSMDVMFQGVDGLASEFSMAGGSTVSLKAELENVIAPIFEPETISWDLT
jgi:hypothetical protein